ncbi:MAG: endonuclease/exonuclease/phosphatase family protein [Burkholderiaceae bacterium]
MKIVAWNIRAGGGTRMPGIADSIQQWQPDIVALSEFRGTPASVELARRLARDAGLRHQRHTTNATELAKNALLVASRWPLRVVRHPARPAIAERWLHVRVAAPQPFALMAVHVPNRVSGLKYPFLDAVARIAREWDTGIDGLPALIVGDTNSGCINIDEESPAFNTTEDQWLRNMNHFGWRDGFRFQRPLRREYTWYSPNGRNGFRLDQAFINQRLIGQLKRVRHVWAGAVPERREVLSDHASLVIDFD